MTARAQAFTLEAFVASILLVATLAFALQVVAVDANTGGPADTELRNNHAGIADGVLDGAAANGSLQSTLLYWNEVDGRFYDADPDAGFYFSAAPNTTFGRTLDAQLGANRIRYNVDLHYREANGSHGTQRLVESGTPSPDAVRVTETVTLYDNTTLVARDETRRENATLASVGNDFYAPDAASDGPIYNVVRVEVVVWRR